MSEHGDEFLRALRSSLNAQQQAQQYRVRAVTEPLDAAHVGIAGRRYVNFASNSYLGLTHHPQVVAVAREVIQRHGVGSGAAGLISGYSPIHRAAEQAIAHWKQMQAAVLLPSGYQANHAAIQTLAVIGKGFANGVRFLMDKLVHASLIDAIRASESPYRVFPHNGLEKLERLLADADAQQLQVVVTESIFSMDGDAADLAGLARLKASRPFVLVVDEAHASGVYGREGSGYAAEVGLADAVDVSIVTLSKSLGCAGGAVCGSDELCQAVVNFGRAYIYSTELPAAVAAAAQQAVKVCREEPWRQQRVRDLAQRVRTALSETGLNIPKGDSPIVPVILGSETAALDAAQRLRERGMLVGAVRPPTVARGSSRLRITLSCEHTDDEINQLIASVGELGG